MKVSKQFLIMFLVVFSFSKVIFSQTTKTFSFGLNITHFSDWENKPLNFFSPEIRYTKFLKSKSALDIGLNAFYAQSVSEDFKNPGDVLQRLIFSTDIGYKKYFNNISVNFGPSIRYRNEKIRASCSYCPFWEFRIQPKKGFVDLGGIAGLNYKLPVTEKFSFELRVAYRIYNHGVNPLSLGIFYNRHW